VIRLCQLVCRSSIEAQPVVQRLWRSQTPCPSCLRKHGPGGEGDWKKTSKDEGPSNGCSDRQLGVNFLGEQATTEAPKRLGRPSQRFCNGLAK
jgi:hypothetical protein